MEPKQSNKFPKELDAIFEKNENDFFMIFLKKKLRNVYKKLNEIQELKKKNELTEAQDEKVKTKASVEDKIKEWRGTLDMYLEAKEEESKFCSPAQIAAFKKVSALLLLGQKKGSACESFLNNVVTQTEEGNIKEKANEIGEEIAKLFVKEDSLTEAQKEIQNLMDDKKGKKK